MHIYGSAPPPPPRDIPKEMAIGVGINPWTLRTFAAMIV